MWLQISSTNTIDYQQKFVTFNLHTRLSHSTCNLLPHLTSNFPTLPMVDFSILIWKYRWLWGSWVYFYQKMVTGCIYNLIKSDLQFNPMVELLEHSTHIARPCRRVGQILFWLLRRQNDRRSFRTQQSKISMSELP